MRAFVGIPIGSGWRSALTAARDVIREADPSWRRANWVAPENLHVTVKFLGELPDESAASLAEDLAALSATRPFDLPLERAVYAVPSLSRATMLWATLLDPDAQAADFARAVDDIAMRYGVTPDSRDFRPHVTLARSKRPRRPRGLGEAEHAARELLGTRDTVSVGEVRLFRSTLTPHGPIYDVLASVLLNGD